MRTKLALAVIFLFLIIFRLYFSELNDKQIKPSTYDALGYYIYLPATFIYEDVRDLSWFDDIDAKYHLSGGHFYQAHKQENGNYVAKYYGGVAFMLSPFFAAAHAIAPSFGYERDGFSRPYQLSISIAALFYSFLALLLLAKLLNTYYSDSITGFILLMVVLATNIPQYMVVDCGQTHAFLFFLYALILWLTSQWHKTPTLILSFAIGAVIGLATFVRPTELVMLFIPLLWRFDHALNVSSKWKFFRSNPAHILVAILGGFLLLLPQIIYWKYTAGVFVYDVGSKWVFLNPFFRVLFGFEKGWFVYTPVCILFVLSLYFAKKWNFGSSVLWFSMLNIWIIISWFDWRYGGSYSTRALSQTYPVFAVSLGTLIVWIKDQNRMTLLKVLGVYLVLVNIVQLYQYNETILHYDHMNARYYQQIYLDVNPEAIDYSLLDTKDWVSKNKSKRFQTLFEDQEINRDTIAHIKSDQLSDIQFLRTQMLLMMNTGFWNSELVCKIIQNGQTKKSQNFRLNRPKALAKSYNEYGFYTEIPKDCKSCEMVVFVKHKESKSIDILCDQVTIEGF